MCKADELPILTNGAREIAAANSEKFVDVAIIGAGLQGLTAAAFLRKEGIEDFMVVDEVRGPPAVALARCQTHC